MQDTTQGRAEHTAILRLMNLNASNGPLHHLSITIAPFISQLPHLAHLNMPNLYTELYFYIWWSVYIYIYIW